VISFLLQLADSVHLKKQVRQLQQELLTHQGLLHYTQEELREERYWRDVYETIVFVHEINEPEVQNKKVKPYAEIIK
jgi:hypothetical protein